MNRKEVVLRESTGAHPKMLAIVIGMGDYPYFPPKLFYTLEDAKDIANILVNNFRYQLLENKPLFDPSWENIDTLLKNLKYDTNHDDILIYYSGHGENLNEMGYIIPSDGEKENSETWISAEAILSPLISSPASNIFLIFDMCYSGSFLNIDTFYNSYSLALQAKSDHNNSQRKKTISLLVAGTSEEEVPEPSHFSHFVKKGLNGYAGGFNDGEITSWEVMNYVITKMAPLSGQEALGDYLIRDEKSGDELVLKWQIPFIPSIVLRDLENKSLETRISAVRKLGIEPEDDRFKDEYFKKIKELITTDSNPVVRHEAIKTVSNLKHPKSLDYLFQLLNKFEPVASQDRAINPTVDTVITAIGKLNKIDAIIPLLDYLSHPMFDEKTSSSIRHHTLSKLISLVSPDHEYIINKINSLLKQEDFKFKETLIIYLRRIGGGKSAAGLFQFLSNLKNDYELRRRALFYIPAIGDEKIIQRLETWVKTEGKSTLGHDGKKVLEDLKRRFGIINWEEKDMLFDLPYHIVVTDFDAPDYLQNALDLEGCSRLSALVDLIVNDQKIPIGDRQLAAISLLENESADCTKDTLDKIINELEEFVGLETNANIRKWVKAALILFKNIELHNK